MTKNSMKKEKDVSLSLPPNGPLTLCISAVLQCREYHFWWGKRNKHSPFSKDLSFITSPSCGGSFSISQTIASEEAGQKTHQDRGRFQTWDMEEDLQATCWESCRERDSTGPVSSHRLEGGDTGEKQFICLSSRQNEKYWHTPSCLLLDGNHLEPMFQEVSIPSDPCLLLHLTTAPTLLIWDTGNFNTHNYIKSTRM